MKRPVRHSHASKIRNVVIFLICISVAGIILTISSRLVHAPATTEPAPPAQPLASYPQTIDPNKPLAGFTFYRDDTRRVTQLVREYPQLSAIADQPGTTWLTGPHASDPKANADIAIVKRTSTAAASQNTVAVYQLYAIPLRDACAGYSGGGFSSQADYLAWVDRIVAGLSGKAIFSVEADSIAHAVQGSCLTTQQITERYDTLKKTVQKLKTSTHTLGVYIDAGHSEWFTDPAVLVDPLTRAGMADASGIAVNVSNFVRTPEITTWSQKLVSLFPSSFGRKGVIIDTSRNGQGPTPANVTGDAKWCNPSGRGIGKKPTTTVSDYAIDAYFWGKNIGESDGDCFGNPPAGTFMPQKALELIRNAEE